MKKILNLFVLLVLLTFLSIGVLAHPPDEPFTTELLAGGGNLENAIPVGQVEVWNDGDYLYVRYIITQNGWCITSTHLHIATSWLDIPQKNGNPIPGQFDYKTPHECVTEYMYQIDITWPQGTELYIAAHADVCSVTGYSSDIEAFAASLPENVVMTILQQPAIDGMSYFLIGIDDGDVLYGEHHGWCADTDREIHAGDIFNVYPFSSYENLPPNTVEFPENLDLVNWILNQNYVGQISPGGYGIYTYGDVQRAIWGLIEDWNPTTGGLGPWNQDRINEILADAYANGEGYYPGCMDLIAIILIPFDALGFPIAQITMIPVPLPCIPIYECETAWGNGFDFIGKNWAMYFMYTIQ